MNAIVNRATAATRDIISEADLAVELLQGYGSGRINSIGVLIDPINYQRALQSVRKSIDRAIAIHKRTMWPSDADYSAP